MNADALLDALDALDDRSITDASPFPLPQSGREKKRARFVILFAAALTFAAAATLLTFSLINRVGGRQPGASDDPAAPIGTVEKTDPAEGPSGTDEYTDGSSTMTDPATADAPSETDEYTNAPVTADPAHLPPVYAIGHEHRTVTVPALAPTCTFPGRTECRYCAICSEVFTAPETLPASGGSHSFVGGVCSLCGARAPSTGLKIEKRGECAVITGVGTCADSSVVLPETYDGLPVTAIGDKAFLNCEGIDEIVFHDGIDEIGALALSVRQGGEDALRLTIHDLARYCAIESAFSYTCPTELYVGSSEVTDLILPLGVTGIPWGAFGNCRSLRRLCMTSFVTQIGTAAFAGCKNLKEADLSFLSILSADSIFTDCSSLERVALPSTMKHLGSQVFAGCTALHDILLPRELVRIGRRAFYGCRSLESVSFSDMLVEVGEDAFYGCGELKKVVVQSIASYCGVYYQNRCASPFAYARELYVRDTPVRELSIPAGVKIIKPYAFAGADIETLTLPEGIESVGESAFSRCQRLKTADLRSLEQMIDNSAFAYCAALERVEFGEDLSAIRKEAFCGCTALTGVRLPDSVSAIGDRAFFGCSSLTQIVLPDRLSCRYGVGIFEKCTSLVRAPALPGFRVGERMFAGCTALTEIDIPSGITAIDREAFLGCTALERVTFGERQKRLYLYEGVFENCTALLSILLPSFLSAHDGIFRGCSSLASVTLTGTEEPALSPGWLDGCSAAVG